MKKATRYLVLFGALALSAAPVFATGPGGTDPPPPPSNQPVNGTSSTGTGLVAAILAYLGL
ncbi:MAG: hypothetical protein WBW84_08605 [Acidobacteriaceae bacterium]